MKISKEKLAKLSKEEKLKLIDILEERKRRQRDSRSPFIPHAEQLAVIKDKTKIRIVVTGNGFGKSALGANEALWAAGGYNPITGEKTFVPAKIYVILDAPEKVDSTWLPELKKWYNIKEDMLEKRGKPYISQIVFDNGSFIKFMFHLQEPLSWESVEGDVFIFDEPPPKNAWVALMRAGRTKGRKPRYLLLGTPISQAWLRSYYVDWEKGLFPDTRFFKGSTDSNKANLAEGYIEDFSRHLSEKERKTRLHGDFFNTEGMALSDVFDRSRHIKPAASLPVDWRSWPAVISLDPHPQKATHACLLLAGPNGQLVYAAERQAKEVPRDWGAWVKANWLQEYRVVDIVVDNFGSGDYTGGEGFKSFVEVWRSMNINVRPTSYDEKLDTEFLERLQDALYSDQNQDPKLKILPNCIGIVRDCENVQWKAQKGTETYQPKLEIGNKDYLACLKYALATNLSYDSAKRAIIRAPGIAKQIAQKPRELGTVEKRWAMEPKTRRNGFHDDDDW